MTPSYAEEALAYYKQKEKEETVKKAKLEPCPFCGEALYSVACTDPRCIASEGRKYLDVTDAVKAWNRRD